MISEEVLMERAAADIRKNEPGTELRYKKITESNIGRDEVLNMDHVDRHAGTYADRDVIMTTLTLANSVIEQQSKLINSYEAIVDAITDAANKRRK